MLPLPVALLIVFGSAKLMAEIFELLRQPAIAGEIVAGALIGPSVLGWISPNDTLKALADLGVIFLLFDVGLQVKTRDLLRTSGTAAVVALMGVIASFLLGWGILLAFGVPRGEALFIGVSMVSTSVGITASALSAKGLLGETAAGIILTAAVIDDLIGLIVLAVISSTSKGAVNVLDIVLSAALPAVFTVVMAVWGPSAVNRIMPHFGARGKAEEAEFHIALVLLFGLSALAMYTGVAAIVGAFLAGIALSDGAGKRVRDLTRGVNELLVPFFLVGIGLQLDFAALRSGLGLAVLILVAALVGKLAGCGLGALRLGWNTALKVAAGMVPRGEISMVVAQIGLGLAVVSSQAYGVIVFMVVASTLITPLLLKIAFREPALETARKDATGMA
jgi:Kef-type K+ transport system membrane component KefB